MAGKDIRTIPSSIFGDDVKLIVRNPYYDNRGYFFEPYNEGWFSENIKSDVHFVQDNESKSGFGTLRGMHYQIDPFSQGKLIRVITGSVIDFVLDIREGSPTFGKFEPYELNGDDFKSLWIPRGFAHGFLSMSDKTIFQYKVDNYWNKESERGINIIDPDLGILSYIQDVFPNLKFTLSEKDIKSPVLKDVKQLFDYKTDYYKTNDKAVSLYRD